MTNLQHKEIISFIRSLYPNQSIIPLHRSRHAMPGQFCDLAYSEDEYVSKFESEISRITGIPYVVATSSGTAALHLALTVCGVGQNDLVITTPFTFIAVAHAIMYTGAHPMFCDVSEETLGLSSLDLKKLLESDCVIVNGQCFHKGTGRRIAACVPVYNYGFPYAVEAVAKLCQEWSIPLIEDAAEALGGKYKDHHAGSFGMCGVLSFNLNKIITTGGGGAVLTKSEDLAIRVREVASHSRQIGSINQYIYRGLGFNYAMPFTSALFGLHQLREFTNVLDRKHRLSQIYKSFFDRLGLPVLRPRNASSHNCWLNVVQFPNKLRRDEFAREAVICGIGVRPGWSVLSRVFHLHGVSTHTHHQARFFEQTLVALPSSPNYIYDG